MKSASHVSLALALAAISGMISCYVAINRFTSTSAPGRSPVVPIPTRLGIAVVDLNRLWQNSAKARSYEVELNEKKAVAKEKWEQLKRSNDKEAAEIFRASQTAELKFQANKYRAEIAADMMRVVASSARSRFDLVFDSSGKSMNAVPFLLIAEGATDITDDVIGRLATQAR